MLAAGIAIALSGCGNEDDQAGNSNMIPEKVEAQSNDQEDNTQSSSEDSSLQQSQQNGADTKKDNDDIELTVPEEEEVDPELLASAQKKMDEGREDELTIDEEIALSSAMHTTTNQADQLAEQGTSMQELVTSGAAKLRSGQKISDAEETALEQAATLYNETEILTLLQEYRHEKNGNKHDKKQITKNVGYADTYALYKKKYGDDYKKSGYYTDHIKSEYYIDNLSIGIIDQRKKDISKQLMFNENKTKEIIEGYLPKDAKFLEFLENMDDSTGNFTGKVEKDGDGEYPVFYLKHEFKYESKEAAKRLNNDGKITVEVVTNNFDRDGNTQEKATYIQDINIRASHPRPLAQ